MAHLKEVSTIEEGIKIGINSRIGSFLSEQRKVKGRAIRTVARKLKIKRSNLKNWKQERHHRLAKYF